MPKSKKGADGPVTSTPDAKKADQSQKSSKSNSPTTPSKNSNLITYKIRLLDSDQRPLEISISKNDNGEVLFNKVCDELGGIIERDYFGLRYIDKNNQRQWLDLGVNVRKQMNGAHSTALSFRVKHYPGNPTEDFHQDISLYLLYLQIRRDLVQGRLLCPMNELYTIGGLILQSEYGDAPMEDESHEVNGSPLAEDEFKTHFKNFKIVFNQTKKIESEILKCYESYRGLTEKDAEIEVLKRASKLPTYGVDPFPVKIISKEKSPKKADSSSLRSAGTGDAATNSILGGTQQDDKSNKSATAAAMSSVYLGLRHNGLTTYVGLQPSETFEWENIDHLACHGQDFIVYLKQTESDEAGSNEALPTVEEAPGAGASKTGKKVKNNTSGSKNKKSKKQPHPKPTKKPSKPRAVTFRFDTKAAALAFWKWTVDRQSFFTLKQASEAKLTKTTHSLFRRSHSYRFIGKSQMELKSLTNSAESLPQPSFVRVSSLRRPKSHEGDFDTHAGGHATLPARLRAADSSASPADEHATKRPRIPSRTVEESMESAETAEPPAISTDVEPPVPNQSLGVMNMANDLRAAPGTETSTPIKGDKPVDPVTVIPVSVSPVAAAAPSANAAAGSGKTAAAEEPLSTQIDEVRYRSNHTPSQMPRDSECLRAVKEIDHAIDSVQNANGHQTKSSVSAEKRPNGEVTSGTAHEIKSSTSATVSSPATTTTKTATPTTTTRSDTICSRGTIIFAMEAAAVLGVVCFGVVIAALETRPVTPGGQSDFWTDLAMNLQGQPIVASFNEYIYAPLRGMFIGGGH